MGQAQSGALCGHHLISPPQRPYEVLPLLLLLPVSMRKLLAQKASNLPKDVVKPGLKPRQYNAGVRFS